MSSVPVPRHAQEVHALAHASGGPSTVSRRILAETPSVVEAVGAYLRVAAASHPVAAGGHAHAVPTRAVIGSYSFVLTLERVEDLPRRPPVVLGTAEWHWHLSLALLHEDTGAIWPIPADEAMRLASGILRRRDLDPHWFAYGVNPAEPLVFHGWIPVTEGDDVRATA